MNRYRIPPSPTGKLHLGTSRTALYNLLLARRDEGAFVFRLEDTDTERSKSEYVTDIIDGLQWLGITWDEGPVRQSEHLARHHLVVRQLMDAGLAYECFCSAEELDELRTVQRAANQLEGYDNRHRTLTADQKDKFRKDGRKPVIRFRLPDNAEIVWNDLVKGEMRVHSSDLGGDPVICRDNGAVLYNFAVVVDDHDARITHVIRGEDHLHNTAKQIALYQAMQWDVPVFGHVPLILTSTREKLSKRKHGDIAGVEFYRQSGYLPQCIVNYLIAMSWRYMPTPDCEQEVFSFTEVYKSFSLENISKSPAIYDMNKLNWFAKEHFKLLTSEDVLNLYLAHLEQYPNAHCLRAQDLQGYHRDALVAMIHLLKDGLTTLTQLSVELSPFVQEPSLTADSLAKLPDKQQALTVLRATVSMCTDRPELLSSPDTARELLHEISVTTNIKKGKALFMPIRLAVSGAEHGADLASMLCILGVDRLRQRIQSAINAIAQS